MNRMNHFTCSAGNNRIGWPGRPAGRLGPGAPGQEASSYANIISGPTQSRDLRYERLSTNGTGMARLGPGASRRDTKTITLATATFDRWAVLNMLDHRTCSDQRHHVVGCTRSRTNKNWR